MKGIILAAGEGTRMYPLTTNRPKVMLPVAGRPILEHIIRNARDAGITDILMVVSYGKEKIEEYFGDEIEYIDQGKALGTAHAISIVEGMANEFVVLSGDTIVPSKEIKKFVQSDGIVVGAMEVGDPSRYGVIEVEGDKNKIKNIIEKPTEPSSNLVNAGIYRLDEEIFDAIRKTGKSKRGEYEITDSLRSLIKKREVKYSVIKEIYEIGMPWDLLDANAALMKNLDLKINCIKEKNVEIKGKVVIGEGTTVKSGSYIEGPTIIGKRCKIGPNCYIRPYTCIGNKCHIGNACEIKNSIIMDGSNAPHHNYIGDSVIGENCNLGSGTKIANLRLDEKNIKVRHRGKIVDTGRKKLGVIMGDGVKTGINSSINVGTIIGEGAFISYGALASGNIPPRTMVY